jgi:hypothetical protein
MGKRRPEGYVPLWKRFGKRDFKYRESLYSRVDAIVLARKLRRLGLIIRIFKVSKFLGDPQPEYRIYRRLESGY